MSVHQKLGIILESKVVQKLNLEKNVFTTKWSPKLIFWDRIFFLERFSWILTSESQLNWENDLNQIFHFPTFGNNTWLQ